MINMGTNSIEATLLQLTLVFQRMLFSPLKSHSKNTMARNQQFKQDKPGEFVVRAQDERRLGYRVLLAMRRANMTETEWLLHVIESACDATGATLEEANRLSPLN